MAVKTDIVNKNSFTLPVNRNNILIKNRNYKENKIYTIQK